ncbi:hypothetical protein SAMN04487851_114121 [Prevotella sp. tc2-28]|uniref:hypothetical protein n=1 Tax=Prevotella sp. tc2-28 TaxID=1761888 RepID=UPI00089B8591|nr:hypothetical protein [Prevotella sp. tc2-28]SEA81148.1 hypothetical protein SAMN04487851_114121 [Prevotella sp. tc2-28]
MKEIRFKQCIQISKSIEGIFRLPCVAAIRKDIFGAAFYDTYGFIMDDGKSVSAREGDWLCEGYNNKWWWFTNEQYEQLKTKEQ